MIYVIYTTSSMVLILLSLLVFYYIKFNKINKELNAIKQHAMLEDLALATCEDLITELRNRDNYPYVIIRPSKSDDVLGLTVDAHKVELMECLKYLTISAKITLEKLIENGSITPRPMDFEDFGPHYGEDTNGEDANGEL